MAEREINYIVCDDIPLERFENFVLPPMPAREVVLLLAQDELEPATSAEVRRLLVDNLMPENPDADRGEIEAFVDERVAELRAALRG